MASGWVIVRQIDYHIHHNVTESNLRDDKGLIYLVTMILDDSFVGLSSLLECLAF